MDDSSCGLILDMFGLRWEGYRRVRKGVKKRLCRHMQELGVSHASGYLEAIRENAEVQKKVAELLTVSISRFFRDRGLWQVLEEDILPETLKGGIRKIKVWSAGCARGEEAYSFKVLWEKMREGDSKLPELQLWATDMNPKYLEKAREGIYSRSSLRDLPPEIQSAYFTPVPERALAVADILKGEIFWKVQNLLTDNPPTTDFAIIFLRNNLLTYYRDDILNPALIRVINSLRQGGYLIIGAHEKISELSGLSLRARHPHIFQKM